MNKHNLYILKKRISDPKKHNKQSIHFEENKLD